MEPAAMTNTDVVRGLAELVGDDQFVHFALVSKSWRAAWGERPPETKIATPHTSVTQLALSFDQGLSPSEKVCAALARLGNTELLQCARDHGCVWGLSARREASREEHFHVLKWARETGFSRTSVRARDLRSL